MSDKHDTKTCMFGSCAQLRAISAERARIRRAIRKVFHDLDVDEWPLSRVLAAIAPKEAMNDEECTCQDTPHEPWCSTAILRRERARIT